MKNLFCIVLAATFAFTASLHAQDKDKDEKDKAADVKDKDKDKAAPADKDKMAPSDKDKMAPKVVETKEVILPVETRIQIGDYLINPSVFYITGACLVAIVGVWYTLLRKRPEEEGAPPA
jgi:Ni/Co efflux regulator RcnB